MDCQLKIWLKRRGPSLELCAELPGHDALEANTQEIPIVTFSSPGSFLALLRQTSCDADKVQTIKEAVIHAIGTLEEVFITPHMELSSEQLQTLGLTFERSRPQPQFTSN